MNSDNDLILDKYETIVFIYSGIPAIILFFMAYGYYQKIVVSYVFPVLLVSIAISFFVFFKFRKLRNEKYTIIQNDNKYKKVLIYSMIFFPLFGVSLVAWANCYLDKSPPMPKNVTVLEKSESHSSRRKRDYYSIYVRSWRPDLEKIYISVSSNNYRSLSRGSRIIIYTKSGFLGLEWVMSDK